MRRRRRRRSDSEDPRRACGRRAEAWVAKQLRGEGWRILHRNLRTPYAEVDLVAIDPSGELVAVEVKAHHSDWLEAHERLRPDQGRRLARALCWYVSRFELDCAARVDLVTVSMESEEPRSMLRIEDAVREWEWEQ